MPSSIDQSYSSIEETNIQDDSLECPQELNKDSVKGKSRDKDSKRGKFKKRRQKVVVDPSKKVGPQKQRKAIHTLLKRAKIYEIRKMTRRIESLRKRQGTADQKAKNSRKCEKLIKEIEAMKGFIIADLVERTIAIFKGTGEQVYVDIWNACRERKKVEELLQKMSNQLENEERYNHIAYLRMLSSKDIVKKLNLITLGVNMRAKSDIEKKKKKKKEKVNDKSKDQSVETKSEPISIDNQVTTRNELKVEDTACENSNMPETSLDVKGNDVSSKPDKKLKSKNRPKQEVDSFFLGEPVANSDSDDDIDDDEDSEEEFSSLVASQCNVPSSNQNTVGGKKNRMGQRQRKKILQEQQRQMRPTGGRNFRTARTNTRSNTRTNTRANSRNGRKYEEVYRKKKFVDVSKELENRDNKGSKNADLHPSWLAKQKLKEKQNIVAFTGTKITFD